MKQFALLQITEQRIAVIDLGTRLDPECFKAHAEGEGFETGCRIPLKREEGSLFVTSAAQDDSRLHEAGFCQSIKIDGLKREWPRPGEHRPRYYVPD